MTCDSCDKKTKTLTPVHVKTGKRGRPPIKNYCNSCLQSEKGNYYLVGEAKEIREKTRVQKAFKTPANKSLTAEDSPKRRGRPSKAAIDLGGFDRAALFLLTLLPENLFEPIKNRDEWNFRCKGCGGITTRNKRTEHFTEHKSAILH